MDEAMLAQALEREVGASLARELSAHFATIRSDYGTRILERASPGKFVETFVQCLQQMATGKYEAKPNVDDFLNVKVDNLKALPEGLRICGARIARAIYSLRNKRSIAHKNEVDPNTIDLGFAHQGAAWIMAEFLRNASGITMQEAGALIELVQTPVGTLVEEIDGVRLVHANLSVSAELLVLLHSHYPKVVSLPNIMASLRGRSPGSVKNKLIVLRNSKHLHGDNQTGYQLTQAGYAAAIDVLKQIAK